MLYVKQSDKCSPLTHYVYIVSTSESKGWRFRKWSDNTLELWMNAAIEFDTAKTYNTEIPNIFMTVSKQVLPFPVYYGSIVCSIDWTYVEWVQSRFLSDTSIEIRRFGNKNSTSSQHTKVSCYIIGRGSK